ncbi:MAG: glycoside hydrolase family 3 [Hyphomicrobiales bacterium]|nr:glycoside hydrolase family 3 [Hyphomicrobiales bacterium]
MRSGVLRAGLLAVMLTPGWAVAGASASTAPLLADNRDRANALHPDRQIELLEKKIGQMLLIGFPGQRPGDAWPRRAAAMIAQSRIGGVILFGHNVRNPAQLKRLTDAFASAGGPPPFIAVDQEGGRIQRLNRRKGFTRLPSAKSIASGSLCDARAAFWATARELASFGININLGPVVDLNINPRSPAIGLLGRSYGADPETVVAFADQFVSTHALAGVLTAPKHFPGHGSAVRDPHHRVVDITATWRPEELQAFERLSAADGVAMIMVGHLIHPRFSDGDRPTSLSRRTMTEVLRRSLGFDGLIVTDDLGMDAITERYGPEEAAIMAVRAGADVLIYANQADNGRLVESVIAAVAGAVAAGRIPESAIDRSFGRIMAAKQALRRPGFLKRAANDDNQDMPKPTTAPIAGWFPPADVAALTSRVCAEPPQSRGDG